MSALSSAADTVMIPLSFSSTPNEVLWPRLILWWFIRASEAITQQWDTHPKSEPCYFSLNSIWSPVASKIHWYETTETVTPPPSLLSLLAQRSMFCGRHRLRPGESWRNIRPGNSLNKAVRYQIPHRLQPSRPYCSAGTRHLRSSGSLSARRTLCFVLTISLPACTRNGLMKQFSLKVVKRHGGRLPKIQKRQAESNKTQLIKVQTMRVTCICQDESCGVSGVSGYALLRGITGHVFIFNLLEPTRGAQRTQI